MWLDTFLRLPTRKIDSLLHLAGQFMETSESKKYENVFSGEVSENLTQI